MNPSGLTVTFNNLSAGRASQIKSGFVRDLKKQGAVIEDGDDVSETGTRGITLDVSQVLITFMTGGAAVALIDCIKAYITRSEQMTMKLVAPDGRTLEINTTNVDNKDIREQLKVMAETVLKAS